MIKRKWTISKKPKRKKIIGIISEHSIQKSFFDYLNKKHPRYRPVCFAIPNDGARSLIQGGLLKQRGLTRGVPDVFCAIGSCGYHGLFIEFKKGSNGTSKEQESMIYNLRLNGYQCNICYSLDDAIKVFESYCVL